jgi:hypothetical protein
LTAAIRKNDDKFYNVRVSKSYKDNYDRWQETDQLGHADLLNTVKLLERAEQFVSDAQTKTPAFAPGFSYY